MYAHTCKGLPVNRLLLYIILSLFYYRTLLFIIIVLWTVFYDEFSDRPVFLCAQHGPPNLIRSNPLRGLFLPPSHCSSSPLPLCAAVSVQT